MNDQDRGTARSDRLAAWSSTQRRSTVVLVDERDGELGTADKDQVHRSGELHRAVSVFAFAEDGRVLLQQRAAGKYHSALTWSNSACTHPQPGEPTEDAARRCMREELGMECGSLRHAGWFIYLAPLPNGLIEHELDHLFVATSIAEPVPNASEVAAWRWATLLDLDLELSETPDAFSVWFAPALAQLRRAGELPARQA